MGLHWPFGGSKNPHAPFESVAEGGGGPPSGAAGGKLAGEYPNPGLAGEGVTEGIIAKGAVTATKLAEKAVEAFAIAAGAVGTAALAAAAVTTEKLAGESVTEAKLANAAVLERVLGKESVASEKIKKEAVTEEKLGEEAVGEKKHGKESVAEAKIKKEAVSEEKLAKEAVGEEKIKKEAVSEAKIKKEAVSEEKLSKAVQEKLTKGGATFGTAYSETSRKTEAEWEPSASNHTLINFSAVAGTGSVETCKVEVTVNSKKAIVIEVKPAKSEILDVGSIIVPPKGKVKVIYSENAEKKLKEVIGRELL